MTQQTKRQHNQMEIVVNTSYIAGVHEHSHSSSLLKQTKRH